MSAGAAIRRLCGPYEHRIASLYRNLYFDLDRCVEVVSDWSPAPSRILEVGCGEGAMTEALARAFPQSAITAIDITPRLGRLYRGERDRVRFLQTGVGELAEREPGAFDLVILADVLHHVPLAERSSLLEAIRAALSPSGTLVLKEWERRATPIHWLCYGSDRWLTGDRIAYLKASEARNLLGATFGLAAVTDEARIRPWRNNMMFRVRR